MSWLTRIFSGATGGIIGTVGEIVDEFTISGEEKQEFKLRMEELISKRDTEMINSLKVELQSKERVLVAELTQGDAYTKRARPTVVYAGLGFIFINYCFVPILSSFLDVPVASFPLPTEFWVGWSGIVGTWSIGRTFEKRGSNNKVVNMITGNKDKSLLVD